MRQTPLFLAAHLGNRSLALLFIYKLLYFVLQPYGWIQSLEFLKISMIAMAVIKPAISSDAKYHRLIQYE